MENRPYIKRDYLSITTLMSFVRCPRSYFFKKSGLVQLHEPSAPNYGTAMHKAVAVALTQGFEPAFKAFCELWDDSLADDKRSLTRARAQLSHYVHTHQQNRAIFSFEKPPEGNVEVDDSVSEYEVPFALDVGLDVPVTGRIDGLVKHRDTGELWGYEFKTTSRLSSNLFDSLEMHPQILAYTMALRTLTGENIRGMMTEAMLIDKSKVDNITHPIPVQDHLVDGIMSWIRYYGELLLACEKRYAETQDVDQSFIRNYSGCSAYPHYYIPSFACDFSNLCRVENWQPLAMGMFGHKPDHKFITLTKEGQDVKP